ncbi:hypothetical protein VTK73DRAFT_2327 [Phialemonium thermophilum]|uniref:Uncharacterized protein n=1 Tax=Phialemonium thermophilum TaxID=223376 RepID=A0ABR3VSB1_9PEZI
MAGAETAPDCRTASTAATALCAMGQHGSVQPSNQTGFDLAEIQNMGTMQRTARKTRAWRMDSLDGTILDRPCVPVPCGGGGPTAPSCPSPTAGSWPTTRRTPTTRIRVPTPTTTRRAWHPAPTSPQMTPTPTTTRRARHSPPTTIPTTTRPV